MIKTKNKILTTTAIALVAVAMGLIVFAPAALANPNDDHNSADQDLCHFDRNSGLWQVITKNEHAADAHERHGDDRIPQDTSAVNCLLRNSGD